MNPIREESIEQGRDFRMPVKSLIAAAGALMIALPAFAAEQMTSTRANKIDKLPVEPIAVEYTYTPGVTVDKQSRALLPADWNKIVKNICVETARDFTARAEKQARVRETAAAIDGGGC